MPQTDNIYLAATTAARIWMNSQWFSTSSFGFAPSEMPSYFVPAVRIHFVPFSFSFFSPLTDRCSSANLTFSREKVDFFQRAFSENSLLFISCSFFFLHYRQTKKWTSALLSKRRSFSINKTLLDSKSSAPTKSLSDIAVKVKECFLIREKMTGVNRKHGCTHLKTP